MQIKWGKLLRKFHFWGAIVIFIPVVIVIATGILLQVKRESAWQPPTAIGQGIEPTLSFDEIVNAATEAPEAGIGGWEDVNRLQVLAEKGIIKVRGENGWEVQVDHQTGDVLQVGYRWVNIVEEMHDGSWFHDKAKLWVFLPSSVILLMLWISGIYLIILPYWTKGQRARKRKMAMST